MENNEMMNNVELDDVIEVFCEDGPKGGGFGKYVVAAAAGYLLVKAGGKVVSWGKNMLANHKAKKTEGKLKFNDVEKKTEDEDVVVK